MSKQKNINIIIDLERLKGEKINSISQYNNAMQRQIIQNQQKMHLLNHKKNLQQSNPQQQTQSQSQSQTQTQSKKVEIKNIKYFDCDCD